MSDLIELTLRRAEHMYIVSYTVKMAIFVKKSDGIFNYTNGSEVGMKAERTFFLYLTIRRCNILMFCSAKVIHYYTIYSLL